MSPDVGVTRISVVPKNEVKNDDTQSATPFSTLINSNEISEDNDRQIPTKYVPVDWALKTKLRILSPTAVQGNGLKISGASGVTRYI